MIQCRCGEVANREISLTGSPTSPPSSCLYPNIFTITNEPNNNNIVAPFDDDVLIMMFGNVAAIENESGGHSPWSHMWLLDGSSRYTTRACHECTNRLLFSITPGKWTVERHTI